MNPSQPQNKPDPKMLQSMLQQAAQNLGADPNSLQQSAQKGSVDQLLKQLKPQDAQNLQRVLADKEATAKVLNSPQAQALMKKLFGDQSR